MAQDVFKPKGQAKASKPDAGGGVIRSEPVLAIVKNNIDSTRAGRIQVYVSDFGAPDPDDSTSWITVSYMSPFFGATSAQGGSAAKDYGTYDKNPSSYGMWYSPPDLGSTVVCIFINGDPNYGYYIGSVLPPELLQMIPAIGASDKIVPNKGEAETTGGSPKLPVTNLNSNNPSLTNGIDFLSAPKPVHSYSTAIYTQQGLLRDPIRGPISTSALRESPSRVGWGVSTPGRPIYQGGFTDADILSQKGQSAEDTALEVIARRGGHSIVMDDGDTYGKDQLIRLRTALGHQILMSDDGQTLFIIHSNGQSYIELGKEGTIDMYSMNSVNVRTQGDLNLHADNNININAKKDLNIAADNININAAKNIGWRAGGNHSGYTLGTYTVKVAGSMSMFCNGQGSYASDGVMYVNGSKINLNTGSTSVVPAEVPLITQVAHTDTLHDTVKGYAAAPGLLLSIVSRAPAHAPWASANQGADVKVTSSASATLPTPPSPTVQATNSAVADSKETSVTASIAATVPPVTPISESLDKNVTATMVASTAGRAAAKTPDVVTTGTGVILDKTGNVNAAVGSFAMTPQQMEAAMVLKPGSAALVTGLVQKGSNVSAAMTNNLFTGAPGAQNLNAFNQNIGSQVGAQIQNFQQAQTALTKVGAITGNETPQSIAGVVNAASQVGVPATANFIQAATAKLNTAGIPNPTNGVGSNVASAIAAGGFASALATNVNSGVGSIATSLGGLNPAAAAGKVNLLDSAKGIAGSAFGAITGSFKSLKAGVPQDLTAIAKTNAEAQAASEAGAAAPAATATVAAASAAIPTVGSAASLSADLVKAQTAISGGAAKLGIPGLTATASSLTSTLSPGLTSLVGNAGSITSSLTSSASSLIPNSSSITALAGKTSIAGAAAAASSLIPTGSGINALPGGAAAAASFVNNSGAITSIPSSISGVSDVLKNSSTSAMTGISNSAASLSSGISMSAGNSAMSTLINSANLNSALSSSIDSGKQSLSSLTSAGLPAGAAAALAASVNSLNSSGPSPIKMPTIAANTVDRSALAEQTTSVLSNPKIPAPNFSGDIPTVPASAIAANKARDKRIEYFKLTQSYAEEKVKRTDAIMAERAKYEALRDSLPEGDPTRAAAKTEINAKIAAYTAWWKGEEAKIETLRLEVNEAQRAEGQAIWKEVTNG
jgi:hypothetical protein